MNYTTHFIIMSLQENSKGRISFLTQCHPELKLKVVCIARQLDLTVLQCTEDSLYLVTECTLIQAFWSVCLGSNLSYWWCVWVVVMCTDGFAGGVCADRHLQLVTASAPKTDCVESSILSWKIINLVWVYYDTSVTVWRLLGTYSTSSLCGNKKKSFILICVSLSHCLPLWLCFWLQDRVAWESLLWWTRCSSLKSAVSQCWLQPRRRSPRQSK